MEGMKERHLKTYYWSKILICYIQSFWDQTGGIWASGGFWGKKAGLFILTGTLGGGQESTAIAAMSTLAHHGITFVPLGYAKSFSQLTDLSEVHGGSSWGAGAFAGSDGSRQPSTLELEIATIQGEQFYNLVKGAWISDSGSSKFPVVVLAGFAGVKSRYWRKGAARERTRKTMKTMKDRIDCP